ncbi:unnamed protein product [Sphagnum balticum]
MKQKEIALAGAAAAAIAIATKLLLSSLKSSSSSRDGGREEGIHIRVKQSASEILKQADRMIALSQSVHDAVAAVPLDEVSYETVIAPLANLEAEEFAVVQGCVFPSLVAVSKDVRNASAEAEKKIDAHNVKCSMREDVYLVVKAYAAKKETLSPQAQRFVDRLIRDYERLGLNLNADTRRKVEFLKTTIGELCIEFQQNMNEENRRLYFTEEELAGLPKNFIQDLKTGKDNKLEVTLKYPHYFPIMERCKVGATRQAVAVAYDQRCMNENVSILEKVVALRHAMAQLLGYRNHAEYVIAIRMAKSPSKVKEFLESMSKRISVLAAKELTKLRAMKKAEEGNDLFGMADLRYYIRKAEEEEFKVDYETVKQYFPMAVVTAGLLQIYQDLLGLKFKEVPNPQVWHPDVQLYSVSDSETGERMGYFYLDLYPRDGKYTHACVCSLQPGCVQKDGHRQLPVAAMLANFSKPTKEKPSLLGHTEVETYFHEFGHVMHHICSRASFAKFSGLRVEDDFVEAPSQMLENWCLESDSLKLMSGFYKDTKQSLPDDICQALMQKRRAFAGLLTKRQILFGLFDQSIHMRDKAETGAILKELVPKVMEGIPMLEGTNFSATFGHMTGGYDAAYYGYLWSEVSSADMFEAKFKGNVLSKSAGREYREKVLAPGACKDAAAILRDFLGREPTEEAFLRSKGLL